MMAKGSTLVPRSLAAATAMGKIRTPTALSTMAVRMPAASRARSCAAQPIQNLRSAAPVAPPETGLQEEHQHGQRVAAKQVEAGGEGGSIQQQQQVVAQIPERKNSEHDRHNRQALPGRRAARDPLPIGWGAHRRLNRGNRVGATLMLDQAPTKMPMLRATANQNRVLPPNRMRATRGSRVVKLVYRERVRVA